MSKNKVLMEEKVTFESDAENIWKYITENVNGKETDSKVQINSANMIKMGDWSRKAPIVEEEDFSFDTDDTSPLGTFDDTSPLGTFERMKDARMFNMNVNSGENVAEENELLPERTEQMMTSFSSVSDLDINHSICIDEQEDQSNYRLDNTDLNTLPQNSRDQSCNIAIDNSKQSNFYSDIKHTPKICSQDDAVGKRLSLSSNERHSTASRDTECSEQTNAPSPVVSSLDSGSSELTPVTFSVGSTPSRESSQATSAPSPCSGVHNNKEHQGTLSLERKFLQHKPPPEVLQQQLEEKFHKTPSPDITQHTFHRETQNNIKLLPQNSFKSIEEMTKRILRRSSSDPTIIKLKNESLSGSRTSQNSLQKVSRVSFAQTNKASPTYQRRQTIRKPTSEKLKPRPLQHPQTHLVLPVGANLDSLKSTYSRGGTQESSVETLDARPSLEVRLPNIRRPLIPQPPPRGSSDGRNIFVNPSSLLKSDMVSACSIQNSDNYDIAMNDYDKAESDSEDASQSDDDDSDTDSYVEEYRPRAIHHHWQHRTDFIQAMLSYCVNFQALWRFPYLCLISGGGSFLLSVLILLILVGIPVFVMESSIGQMTRSGPVRAMERLCTLSQGLGVAMSLLSFITAIYYNVLMSWSLHYTVASSNKPLRWESCQQVWIRNDTCVIPFDKFPEQPLENITNVLVKKRAQSPIEQYLYRRVLNSSGADVMTILNPRGELIACCFVTWVLVYFSIWKRKKGSRAMRCIPTLMIYILLLISLSMVTMQPGAAEGINYLFTVDSKKLRDPVVWCYALGYVFNMLGIGFGVPIELSASNMFNNKNIIKNSVIIIVCSVAFSLISGITSFAAIGCIAFSKGIGIEQLDYNVETITLSYVHMLSLFPAPQIWLVIFFFLLLTTGMMSQFSRMDLVMSAIQDYFWKDLNKYLKSREILAFLICLVGFILSIPYLTRGGIHLLFLTDIHIGIFSPAWIVIFEIIFVCWIYSSKTLARNIKEMTEYAPNVFFRWSWTYTAPIIISVVIIFQVVASFTTLSTIFPAGMVVLGWFSTLVPLIWIVCSMTHILARTEGKTLRTRMRIGLQTNIFECRCHKYIRSCPRKKNRVSYRPSQIIHEVSKPKWQR